MGETESNNGKLLSGREKLQGLNKKLESTEGLAKADRLPEESQDRLKFAIDLAGLGTWEYNPETKALVYDWRCCEMLNLQPSPPADIPSLLSLIHADARIRVEQSIKDALLDNAAGLDLEFKTADTNETAKWLKAKGRVYFKKNSAAARFIGTLSDITEQKITDENTRDLLKIKDEFISVASHEIKTPITALKIALQLAEKVAPKNAEASQAGIFVKKAIKQVDKLIELVKDLLEVTKIQSGKLELRKSKFVIGELIKECGEELFTNLYSHEFILEGDLSAEVYADKNRLEQVIINLLSNAIKYSPNGKKVVAGVAKLNEGVKISITDFGIGIPNDQQPLLFDRFYRVDEGTQTYAGAGLGLYISSQIIKKHDGHIYIESEKGKGSTFWFTVPAEKEERKPAG